MYWIKLTVYWITLKYSKQLNLWWIWFDWILNSALLAFLAICINRCHEATNVQAGKYPAIILKYEEIESHEI